MRIIGGMHRNRKLAAPKGETTRPTSERMREAVFNICQESVCDARVLDLFAGSGAIGLEALSRGASNAVFVDINRNALRCLKTNISLLGFDSKSRLLPADVYRTLDRLVKEEASFDLIYIDPPYSKGHGNRILKFFDENDLLAEEGTLFIEESAKLADPSRLFLKKKRKFGMSTLYQYSN